MNLPRQILARYGAQRVGLVLIPVGAGVAALLLAAVTGGRQPVAATVPAWTAARPATPAAPAPPRPIDLAGFKEPAPGFAVISPFGLRQLPWEDKPRLHAGVDIVAPLGTSVRAVAWGTVKRTGADSGYGRYVEVEHLGGVVSFYAHLAAVSGQIRPGVTVGPGAVLGTVGSTGASTGAHLHFEMRNRRGRPLDPAFFIGRTFARIEDWPLKAAALISPKVRIAVVSNIPGDKLALMIAREEAQADEAAMLEMMQSAALDASDVPVETASAEPPPPEAPAEPEEAPAAAPEPAAPPEPAPPPPPRRPVQPPRLAMPD